MDKAARGFLRKLVETPSPSGYEQPAQALVRARMKEAVDELRTDVHGNVIGVKNPDAPMRVMLAGHCDEIGLMVTHVDGKGCVQHGRGMFDRVSRSLVHLQPYCGPGARRHGWPARARSRHGRTGVSPNAAL